MNDDLLQLPTGLAAPDDLERKPRLLIVDDQPVNIQALYRVFAGDHQVFMATSGAQALEVCATQRPDLVLLDVVMPGMDGHAVCRELKADPDMRAIPVIFVTAQNDDESETQGLDAGAVDFITKPFNASIVRARVRTHLTLKRQSDLLRHWVYIDGLTGLCNRRYFDSRLDVEWRRALRAPAPLSVALIDVDHFKRFNDHHGHQAGDDCLRRVAALLRRGLLRPADLVARYGGEEFVVLMPETDAAGAGVVAGRMRAELHEAALAHGAPGAGAVVTVSIGVACRTPAADAAPDALLRAADEALYRAKSLGRDRVCAADAVG